jgi:hypothetical protein
MTSDKMQPDIRTEHNRIQHAQEYLFEKISKVKDQSEIVLSGDNY